jgi:glycosyltransferase involved in cell wall biosynthesis
VPAAPRVSITMPAYGAEATIREAVESALAQTVSDFELIIVDDGSPVPVADVLDDMRDERVRIVRHERNRGLGAARNTALREVRAPLLTHLDADDLIEAGYLEALLPCFDDPAVGLAYPNVLVSGHGEDGPYIRDPERHPVDTFPELALRNPIPVMTVVRTSAVRAVGGYEEGMWGAMDWMLYLELATAGWRFAYVDRMLAHYRWSDTSMSNDWDRVQHANLQVMWRFMLRHPTIRGPHRRVLKLALRELYLLAPGVRAARLGLRSRGG